MTDNPTRPAPPVRPTLQSIADRAGVSHQTVSNVLNSPHKVAEETRKRVLGVIEELNYRPNETARSLARRTTQLISFHLSSSLSSEASILNPFMAQLARTGRAHGYRVVLDVASEDDDDQIASYEELHARRSVDGVVIPETHVGDRRPGWLRDHGIPMVAFGRPWDDAAAEHSWVDVDGGAGMRMIAAHLVEQGHRRIAYVGPARDGGMEDDRLDGLLSGLQEAGVDASATPHLAARTTSELRDVLPGFLRTHGPTAVACRDDYFAFEVAQLATELGLRIGEDLAVTGFDDSELSRRAQPGITSVAQPITDVVDLIWQSLLSQFADADAEPLQRIVQPHLVARTSTLSAVPHPHPESVEGDTT